MIGEAIEVNLHIVDKTDILTLPSSCVFLKDGQNMVYKVVDNKAQIAPVKVGYIQENTSEIIDGIKEGDLVISDGQGRLYPEIMVKIYNPEKK